MEINGISIFQIEDSDIINIMMHINIINVASNVFFVSAIINDMLN